MLNVRVQNNLNHEKIVFTFVQKSLVMHITNQKFSFDIFIVHLQNFFMEHNLYLIS